MCQARKQMTNSLAAWPLHHVWLAVAWTCAHQTKGVAAGGGWVGWLRNGQDEKLMVVGEREEEWN